MLQKLSALLQLPPNFDLLKARIVLLRVTIPVDIYSSPIVVDVDGVEGHLQVLSELEGGHKKSRLPTNHDRKRSQLGKKGKKIEDDVQSGDDEDDEVALPSAVDLAESFLQTEPPEERAELEAVITSHPQALHESLTYSDDGEDDSPVGTGTGLTLPSFMANFLKGIVDRLQVRIQGISLNVDVDVSNDFTPRPETSSSVETVTLELKIDDIDIEGVTVGSSGGSGIGGGKKEPPNMARKDGKRRINLHALRGALISDASVFATLARSSVTSSPSTTHFDLRESAKDHAKAPSTLHSSASGLVGISSPERSLTASQSSHNSEPFTASQHNDTTLLSDSAIASDSGRFDDAPEDEEVLGTPKYNPAASNSDIGESVFDQSAYLDQLTDSQFEDGEEDVEDNGEKNEPPFAFASGKKSALSRIRSPLSTPRASIYMPPPPDPPQDHLADFRPLPSSSNKGLKSTYLPSRPRPSFTERPVSRSQPLPAVRATEFEGWPTHGMTQTHENAQNSSESSSSSSSTRSGDDALAQSQLFSHEDAESMYMSALSQGSATAQVPGGWDSSSSEGAGLHSAPQSPILLESTHQETPDNLEHARQVVAENLYDSTISSRNDTKEDSSDGRDVMNQLEPGDDTPERRDSMSSSQHLPGEKRPTSRESSASTSQITPVKSTPTMKSTPSSTSAQSTESSEYTKVAKQLFSLDQIAIFLPPTTDPVVQVEVDSMLESTVLSNPLDGHNDPSFSIAPHLPGAFAESVYSPRARPIPARAPSHNPIAPAAKIDSNKNSIEIVMGNFEAQFDVSVGRLISKVLYGLSGSLNTDGPTPETPKEDESTTPFALKFRADRISLKFLERLASTTLSSGSGKGSNTWTKPLSSDVLLRTTLKGLDIKYDVAQTTTAAAVTLQRFVFGYAKENIISFDADLRMRESTRDLAASAGVDLSIDMTRTKDATRYKVSTLPVHVSIDLQKLDETFSWFGGLSSVLNMGSSIASNSTLTAASPAKVVSKPRGVRFEAPIKPDDESMSNQNKVNARIGGFVLDLVGKDCSVGLDTSALKIVCREEAIAMAVDKIRVSGPHLNRSQGDPAILADIIGTRIEFLQAPKDVDLDKLLSLITPSKAKYDRDDDILLDTLLRQRRQGSVLRVTIDSFKTKVTKLSELNHLPELGEELAKLSTVAKYLPEDDRPGLLSLIVVRDVDVRVEVNEVLGSFQLRAGDIEVAQITFPSLVALSVKTASLHRNGREELMGAATNVENWEVTSRLPAIMARIIGDEMEPVIRVKLWNLRLEYRVPLIIAILGLSDTATTEDMATSIAASVATLTDRRPRVTPGGEPKVKDSRSSESKPMMIDVGVRDCILGLNPLGLPSKVLIVLTEAHVSAVLPKDNNTSATAEMSKGSILVVDDVSNVSSGVISRQSRREAFDGGSRQVADICSTGYVLVSYISSAKAVIQISGSKDPNEKCVDVELRNDLLIIESCADSTQTLVATLNGLKPPMLPSKEVKYRTKVIPIHNLLSSLSGEAFGTAEGNYDFDEDFGPGLDTTGKRADDDDDETSELGFDSHYYGDEDSFDSFDPDVEASSQGGSILFDQTLSHDTNDGVLLESFRESQDDHTPEELSFQEDHFGTGSVIEGTAHQWNSAKNTYDRAPANQHKVRESPLKVRVRDVHVIWNLFDGYDWQHTRDTITKAVQDVESKAIEKRARNERRPTFEQDIDDEETVIGDFLFNSIYIGIPSNRDPRELAMAINQELNDNATETESVATTVQSASPSRQGGPSRYKGKKLRLNRSKQHKITFELKGVNVDIVAFPPGSGETESSIDVRVRDFDIFDHVPTSTWRKFATYMQDAGERESGTSQIHLEILNVKPVPELAASEIVLKATVLPLRLHVDQDALDFITRFFEFKDDSSPASGPQGEAPFIQRAEVNSVVVKLDFKPKRVDYAGLRSGHTTEFMNFLILDEADMVLRHTIIYGVSGFDKLGKCLNDIWMPDVKRNQLPGILAGLAPVRSLANVGGGVRDLVVIPMREYRKDGRVVRSISKGAAAFARTTGTELIKLGAKLAIGTQTVLQGAEGLLTKPRDTSVGDDIDEEEKRQISLYADQPVGVVQGLRGAYASLERDLVMARDAIIAVPGEVMESGTAQGAAKAVLRRAPTVILRPMIGASKAVGQTLMGATNSLDPQNRRKVEDVSSPCSYPFRPLV